MSKFSVVVISYNGKEFLRGALQSIKSSDLLPEEIIVVDDFSQDGTSIMIETDYPEIRLIRNQSNLGPVASRNKGADPIRTEYVIFLDNDVRVRPNTFSELIRFLESNPKTGLVGPKSIPEGKEKTFWNMGYDPNNFREFVAGILYSFSRIFPAEFLKRFLMNFSLNYWDYNRTIEVDWLIENCLAMKLDIFRKIGGFDERFFMFFEEADLCRRVRNLGYRVYFHPGAQIDLLDSHTHPDTRHKFFVDSKYKYYQKYYFPIKSNPLFFWVAEFLKKLK